MNGVDPIYNKLGDERLARDKAGPYVEIWDGDRWMRSSRVDRLAAERIDELEAEVAMAKGEAQSYKDAIGAVNANATAAWAEVDRLRGLIDHAAIELMRHAGENHNANLAHYLRGELNNRDGAEPAEAGEGE